MAIPRRSATPQLCRTFATVIAPTSSTSLMMSVSIKIACGWVDMSLVACTKHAQIAAVKARRKRIFARCDSSTTKGCS